MENPITLIPLTVGPVFVLAGIILFKFPPKKINWIYGYRTPGSMKSKERWVFAQKYSAKEMIRQGCMLLVLSAIGFVYRPPHATAVMIGTGVLALSVVVFIVRVERAILNRFQE